MTRTRRAVSALLLAVLGTVASVLLGEGILRAIDYKLSPVVFLVPDKMSPGDYTAGLRDERISATEPVAVWDERKLWRLNHAASRALSPEGFRREPRTAGPASYVVAAVGDSNTIGPLHRADHWPGLLQQLAARGGRPETVAVNAGVYGYSSFQGLERLADVLAEHPALVLLSFGINDATPARATDAERAAAVEFLRPWAGWRLAPVVGYALWWAQGKNRGPLHTFRVPVDDYRANLVSLVDRSRAAGAVPVLLTRPFYGRSEESTGWMKLVPRYNEVTRDVAGAARVPLVDAAAEFDCAVDLFDDTSHFNAVGNARMAEFVLGTLAEARVFEGVSLPARGLAVDLAAQGDRPRELGPGFWPREDWSDGRSGRWTAARATVRLQGRPEASKLQVDLSFAHPGGLTVGRVEVDGRTRWQFSERNGRVRRDLDLEPGEPRSRIDLVVENPFVPAAVDEASHDERRLGLFAHFVGIRAVAARRGKAS
jgi:lysophospholipase L1-like esterase